MNPFKENKPLRNCILTIYDPTEDGRTWDRPKTLPNGVKYMCGQTETCPTTGRNHWQIHMNFHNSIRPKAIRELIGCNWAFIKEVNNNDSNRYCIKEETSNGNRFELGTKSTIGRKPKPKYNNINITIKEKDTNIRISDYEFIEHMNSTKHLRTGLSNWCSDISKMYHTNENGVVTNKIPSIILPNI